MTRVFIIPIKETIFAVKPIQILSSNQVIIYDEFGQKITTHLSNIIIYESGEEENDKQ